VNIFNRVFLTLLLFALGSASIAVIVLTWSAPTESIDALADAVSWLDQNHGNAEKSLITAVAALIALITLLLLYFELTPRSAPEVMVTDLEGARAYLSAAAISQRVEEAVSQVPHISDVKAVVRPKKKGVTVSLDLHVDPDANIATVADEACAAARDVLTNRVHVALVEPPRARLHYRELRLNRATAARRGAAPTPTVISRPEPPPAVNSSPDMGPSSEGEPEQRERPARAPRGAAAVGEEGEASATPQPREGV
jgi:hypothetical protein